MSTNTLFSGTVFDNNLFYDNNFEDTSIYKFLNEYMAYDMFRDNLINDIRIDKDIEPIKNRMNTLRKRIRTIKER